MRTVAQLVEEDELVWDDGSKNPEYCIDEHSGHYFGKVRSWAPPYHPVRMHQKAVNLASCMIDHMLASALHDEDVNQWSGRDATALVMAGLSRRRTHMHPLIICYSIVSRDAHA